MAHLFMLTQDVSNIPMMVRTPSSISLMTTGGARRDRISPRVSVLIPPTAYILNKYMLVLYHQ